MRVLLQLLLRACTARHVTTHLAIGRWGTEWGDKYRSQIMFVAFWVSFVSLILLGAAVACVSTDPDSIKNVPFFTGVVTVGKVDGSTSEFNIYAGLNRVVVEDCDLGAVCPPHSIAWSSVHCDQYFSDCNTCASASLATVPLVIMSFVAQIPQCLANIGRSMGKYDLHCQKFMGILSGVLGLVGTFGALYAFIDSCFLELDSDLLNLSLRKTPGLAFVLLVVAIAILFDPIYDILAIATTNSTKAKPGVLRRDRFSRSESNSRKQPSLYVGIRYSGTCDCPGAQDGLLVSLWGRRLVQQ